MSNEFSAMLDSLLDGESLSDSQAYELMMQLASGDLPDALAGAQACQQRQRRNG